MNKSIIIVVVLLILSTNAFAGGKYIGTVRPYFYDERLYLAPVSIEIINKPACATRGLLRLQEMDLSDPVFKYKYAMLLASWIAEREVELRGTGECTSEGDEIIFVVKPQ